MTRRRTIRNAALAAGLLAAALLFVELVLPHTIHVPGTASHRWQTPASVLVLGLATGLAYGLLGVGLVLIYRSNRIINFAHGQMGAFGAVIFVLLVTKAHFPYWVALVPALAVAGLVGALTDAAVIRRLSKAPLVMSVVATLGVGQFLVVFGVLIYPSAGAGSVFPEPPGMPTFSVGAFQVTPAYSAMLILSPVVVAALGLFLRYSRIGVAMRCAADNPEAARMAGIFSGRMSALAWALGASVAAFAAILTAPTHSVSPGDFGPQLLEVSLAAAVIGRTENLPVTLVAGSVIGVIEQLLLWNYPGSGVEYLVLFVLIVAALILQRSRTGRTEEKGSWVAIQAPPAIPARLRVLRTVRAINPTILLVTVVGLALLPMGMKDASAVTLTSIFALVVVGFSMGVVTGLAGQLTLGQFAIAAVGAIASFEVASRTHDYVLSFLYAGVAAALAFVLIGLPAIRVKGLMITVTTLSFALLMSNWLLPEPWLFGVDGKTPGTPSVLGAQLNTGKRYYWLALVLTVLALLIARNLRSAGLSRLFVAVRDNEDAARAFTVPVTMVKLQGFAISGFIAGIGGAMYAHSLFTVGEASFTPNLSVFTVTVMTVIGGLGLLTGPILGALVVLVLPSFVHLGSLALAGTALGQLLIVMYLPGGIGHLVTPLRDRVVKAIGRRAGVDVDAAYLAESSSAAADDFAAPTVAPPLAITKHPIGARPILEASGLVKSFGGVHAVRGVSITVHRGETLGLIGPNGAGKTTTFELLTGFTKPDAGQVRLRDEDVTAATPEARGRLGLIRSFQDAALFPTLTVLECVQLSLERTDPSTVTAAVLGLTGRERRKEQRARDLVAWMGLDRYRSMQVQSLSTGTRRIAEIACLVGLGPEVLLLDEPSAGVAQRETEALQQLLETLKEDLDLTLCVIEHDIPMIMSMADRIVCMADGEIIAEGSPDIVRTDPRVVESYLGGSITAIQRSGSVAHDGEPPAQRSRGPALVRTAG
ncbi:MAG TPA: branched-chain amino acid ABC transporter permease/ATP-binding protein [Mycobacteriales bacterium]|nr:branched-chain amino acid ABC transporter permease/ATP-binding protein [Mycobacteriales bacterium]